MQHMCGCVTNLNQLVKVGVCDICQTDEGLPVLLPLLRGLLVLQEGLKLLLHLSVQFLQIELGLSLPSYTTYP